MNGEIQIFELLEDVLNDKKSFKESLMLYNKISVKYTDINTSKINCVKRSILSFFLVKEKDEGWSDLLVNLRMVIKVFNRRLKINDDLKSKIEEKEFNSDLIISTEGKENYINIGQSKIKWLDNYDDIELIYNFEQKAPTINRIVKGDLRLKQMTGFDFYSSACQKFIIRAIENQLPGTTILSTMPTGGGKSLPNQFVSFFEKSGTTIVVVPTVALAIDQCKSSEKYFNNDRVCRTYYDGISEEDREDIFSELLANKVAIMYLSPESIINGKFNTVIRKAAEMGIIKRLVVDEAHIIAEWGEFFRTEFQFLSIFRKDLIKITNGELRTVLLSATVTERTEMILKNLYSEGNNFIQIRGDSLRNEIIYYISRCNNEYIRRKRILEIISRLPRPLIIYVPVIEMAHVYLDLLKENEYSRVRMFTSETSSSERKSILNAWDEDGIDIIVATSAFGMGVNKKEVRSVIHTFVPESIDRFYQEVGRCGRDGYNALSFIFTSLKEDEKFIKFFTRSKVLTVQKIVERWKAIIEDAEEQLSGDELWVSVEAVPEKLKDAERTGSLNIAWNEYVLLFLHKMRIIEILNIKKDAKSFQRRILIKLLRVDLINNISELEKELEPKRNKERELVDKEIHLVKEMIQQNKKCWSNYYRKAYSLAENKCNGCPVCRDRKYDKYTTEDYFTIEENMELLKKSLTFNRSGDDCLVLLDGKDYKAMMYNILNKCNELNIDCLVIPDNISYEYYIWEKAKESRLYFYSYNDFISYNEESLVYGNIAIIMSDKDDLNDRLYKKSMALKGKGNIKRLMVISEQDLYIKSEGKTLSNIIEGLEFCIGGK